MIKRRNVYKATAYKTKTIELSKIHFHYLLLKIKKKNNNHLLNTPALYRREKIKEKTQTFDVTYKRIDVFKRME